MMISVRLMDGLRAMAVDFLRVFGGCLLWVGWVCWCLLFAVCSVVGFVVLLALAMGVDV